YNPKPDRAWQVCPLAERSFVQADVPGSTGKLVFPKRRCRRRADATERVVLQPAEGRPAPGQCLPAARVYPGRRVLHRTPDQTSAALRRNDELSCTIVHAG